MNGELVDLYGRRVHVYYKETWVQEAGFKDSKTSIIQSYSGLDGIVEKDTQNFIFLKDVMFKRVKGVVESERIKEHIVSKDLVGGITPE